MNKKTWHTGHIRNIEKVWQAEQKALKEKQRLEQLKKELAEERQIEELRKMQADAGLISKSTLNRLDWMYTATSAGPSTEEYLLGKEYTGDKGEGIESVTKLKEAPGSLFIHGSGNERLESENRVREDPMMEVLRAEQKQRHNILKNPVKMKDIKKAALVEKLKQAAKKMKKAQKKKKKEKERKKEQDKKKDEDEKKGEESKEELENKQIISSSTLKVSEETVNKYGLIHLKPTAPRARVAPRKPSPSPEKEKYRGDKRKTFDSKGKDGRAPPTKLTEEEKQRRLKEMMADAETHDREQFQRMLKARKVEKAEEEAYKSRSVDQPQKAEAGLVGS